jgi:hypothetical protein
MFCVYHHEEACITSVTARAGVDNYFGWLAGNVGLRQLQGSHSYLEVSQPLSEQKHETNSLQTDLHISFTSWKIWVPIPDRDYT